MLSALSLFAKTCAEYGGSLPDRVYGIPTWYKYLESADVNGKCSPVVDLPDSAQQVVIAILLAVFDILIFFAGLIAVIFVIVGAVQFITSQGEPDKIKNARTTIMNALIGLVIVVTSTILVNVIGNTLT